MANLYAHGKNFLTRLIWLSPLMGFISTLEYLFAARGKPFAVGQAKYKGLKFSFRNCDSTAIKEVLVDEEYGFLQEFLKSSSEPIIVDVGAHIGTFSLWAYHQNIKSRVLMVEADPDSYDILVANIQNIFPENQYRTLHKAAWKNNDTLKFSTTGDSMGHKVSSDGNVEVNGMTFADIIHMVTKDWEMVDLMKIDIEGAEEAFFETADEVLTKVKRLVIELHPKLCDVEGVKNKLKKHYKVINEIPRPRDCKPILYCAE